MAKRTRSQAPNRKTGSYNKKVSSRAGNSARSRSGSLNAFVYFQRTAGNQAVHRLVRGGTAQTRSTESGEKDKEIPARNKVGNPSPGDKVFKSHPLPGPNDAIQMFSVNVPKYKDFLSGYKSPFTIDITDDASLKDEVSNYIWGAICGTGYDTHVMNNLKAAVKGQGTGEKRAYYDFIRSVEDKLGYKTGFQIKSPGSAKVDNTAFKEIDKITSSVYNVNTKRDALFAISIIIEKGMKKEAMSLVKLLANDSGKKRALTNQVRSGAKHEHVKTSTVVDGLISDLIKLQSNKNISVMKGTGIGYTRWDLLNDTVSPTQNIVLNKTTGYIGDPFGNVQDHHSTSINNIGVELKNGTRKQFVGKGSGTGPYHSTLDNVNRNKNLSPLEMCEALRGVNEKWLAGSSTITASKMRAHQYIDISGEKWFDNPKHKDTINTELGTRRNAVIDRFTKVENRVEDP